MKSPLKTTLSILGLAGALGIGWLIWIAPKESVPRDDSLYSPKSPLTLTFNKDIAPIIFENCSTCHRPGEAGPFNLLSYKDIAKRAEQIVEVTQSRFMPPWLPEPGHGDFVGERRLSDNELGMLVQWVSEGAPQGDASNLPRLPEFTEGWQLGPPDLVVTMPEPYMLPADGRDIYRNFVVPIPLDSPRYVRAMEFRPGNPKVVHHTFLRFDTTSSSRQLDTEEVEPGFGGMNSGVGATSLPGLFSSWQPGRAPQVLESGMSWRLRKGTDLVLQSHMRPSGKIEPVQSSVGFYFTDEPPTKIPYKLSLISRQIDIPAGEKDYTFTKSFILPVDTLILGVSTHAHYLCKRMEGFATLPDGKKIWLILIKQWDFNWQGEYRYRTPIPLPKGTKLTMRYSYDNSKDNFNNPNDPPKRVRWGWNTDDEMGELWVQLLVKSQQDRDMLGFAFQRYVVERVDAYNAKLIRENPNHLEARIELGRTRFLMGRFDEAVKQLRWAVRLNSRSAKAHYNLGKAYEAKRLISKAEDHYFAAIELDPHYFAAHMDLASMYMGAKDFQKAKKHLDQALNLIPDHFGVFINLGMLSLHQRQPEMAVKYFTRAIQIEPNSKLAAQNLEFAKRLLRTGNER